MENHFNCIYCYTNKINGKKYIGQAKNFKKRHMQHIRDSYNENILSYKYPFHSAIRYYNIENFTIEILKENLQTQCLLNLWEKYYIDKFNTLTKNQKGYNIASGGSNGNNFAGKTEEEMREIGKKIAKSWNNKSDEEKAESTRKRLETISNKSDEEKAEYCRKMSKSLKGKNKGKHHSEETKIKISKAVEGEKHPRARKIGLVDPSSNNIIKSWNCIIDAATELNCSRKTINNYLNGRYKNKLYKGFTWKYLD